MAMMDRQGLVFILGRKKDMIRRGGVTIAPAVIESCVAAFTQCQVCDFLTDVNVLQIADI
jgi:4-coumarate--CoA ligase